MDGMVEFSSQLHIMGLVRRGRPQLFYFSTLVTTGLDFTTL